MLHREQVKSFYNRFGNKQDWQRFYEGSAIRDLLAHGGFEKANAVFELGCGTGRFAADLLRCHLPETATYRCFDLSSTMVILAGNRLAKYGDRARVHLTDGSPKLSLPDSQFDRFISNYVLDILPPVATWGIPSEVVVACKLPTEPFTGSGSQLRPQGKEHHADKRRTGGKT